MQPGILGGMKTINRLETTWTPSWDLGLQEEFGFVAETAPKPAEAVSTKSERGWSRASAEVFNRQVSMDRRLGGEANSVGALIAFFETLTASEE